ncbi:hepatic lectin-like isoform X2 [Pseudophryne corroboree]|uniref:hepatic lectin-like isoform X2 n=1 Tax=Pseudophryne corroboree TaxID=495146 RepID=UPI0030812FF0
MRLRAYDKDIHKNRQVVLSNTGATSKPQRRVCSNVTRIGEGEGRMSSGRETADSVCSYFKQKSVILTFGLLAISYILVITLFINVLSRIGELTTKVKQMEQDLKKAPSCGPNWERFECSCYYFSYIKSNWMKARAMCIGRDSDLTVITSEAEQNFVSAKTKNIPFWIGLNDIKEEGKWEWLDGTNYTSSYKAWKKGEPNDQGKEDCVYLWTNGEWNDMTCSHDKYFAICEKKLF